jgi:hypothetical protein
VSRRRFGISQECARSDAGKHRKWCGDGTLSAGPRRFARRGRWAPSSRRSTTRQPVSHARSRADRDQSTIGPRGGCFGAARTSANPCGARRLGLDHQPMAVLDQDMTHAARSGLLAAAFGQR